MCKYDKFNDLEIDFFTTEAPYGLLVKPLRSPETRKVRDWWNWSAYLGLLYNDDDDGCSMEDVEKSSSIPPTSSSSSASSFARFLDIGVKGMSTYLVMCQKTNTYFMLPLWSEFIKIVLHELQTKSKFVDKYHNFVFFGNKVSLE